MGRRLTPLAAGLLTGLWVVAATCTHPQAAEFGGVGRTEYNSPYMNGSQMSQIQEAIKAIKTGDKKTGQRILQQLVEINPDNETAWMWFAAAADEPHRKKQYLQRVLEINPNNTTARQGLNQLEGDEPKEELPRLNDIVPNSSLPQTEFITKTELARKTRLAIAIVTLVFPLYSIISLITLLILNLEYMGKMIFSCRSMGVSADSVPSQQVG